MNGSTPSIEPISSSMYITSSLAPPWSGPLRVPTAVVMALYMSLRVAMVTRAAKVDALRPWSACRMRHTSRPFAMASVGFSPLSIHRKFVAMSKSLFGRTKGLPER